MDNLGAPSLRNRPAMLSMPAVLEILMLERRVYNLKQLLTNEVL